VTRELKARRPFILSQPDLRGGQDGWMFEDGVRERREIRRMQSGIAAVADCASLGAAWTASMTHFAVPRIPGVVCTVIPAAGPGAALLRGALSGAEQRQVARQKRADDPENRQPLPCRRRAHGILALPGYWRTPLMRSGLRGWAAGARVLEFVDLQTEHPNVKNLPAGRHRVKKGRTVPGDLARRHPAPQRRLQVLRRAHPPKAATNSTNFTK
jgi:hypothetical protein